MNAIIKYNLPTKLYPNLFNLKEVFLLDPDIDNPEDDFSLAEEMRLFNNLSSLADSGLSLHV